MLGGLNDGGYRRLCACGPIALLEWLAKQQRVHWELPWGEEVYYN